MTAMIRLVEISFQSEKCALLKNGNFHLEKWQISALLIHQSNDLRLTTLGHVVRQARLAHTMTLLLFGLSRTHTWIYINLSSRSPVFCDALSHISSCLHKNGACSCYNNDLLIINNIFLDDCEYFDGFITTFYWWYRIFACFWYWNIYSIYRSMLSLLSVFRWHFMVTYCTV